MNASTTPTIGGREHPCGGRGRDEAWSRCRRITLATVALLSVVGSAGATEDPFDYRPVPDFFPVSEYVRVAVGPDGATHLLTLELVSGPSLEYVHFEYRDGLWTKSVVDEVLPSFSYTSQLVVDAEGGLHAAYGGQTEVVYFHRPPGGEWSTTLIPEPDGAVVVDLVVDASGDPHLVWERLATVGDAAVAVSLDGGPFTIIQELTDFQEPAIDLTPHGSALVSGWDGDSILVWFESDGRVAAVPTDPERMARGFGLEIDLAYHDGALHTVYSEGFCLVLQRSSFSGTTSTDTLGCALVPLDTDVQVAIGPDGTVHASGSFGLYARQDPDGTPFTHVLPGVGVVGLATDGDGLPVLAYRFDGAIWIADSRLSVVEPAPGSRVTAGDPGTVTWRGGGMVDVELSPDGGISWIPMGSSGDGRLDVTWPDLATDDARIRLIRDGTLATETIGSPFAIGPERALAWTADIPLATSFARASIAATEAGGTVILAGTASDLRAVTRDRTGWRSEVLDSGSMTPSDLLRGADGTLHAIYVEEETALRYASRDEDGWAVEEIASGLYYRPEAGVDAGGTVHAILHADDDTEHVHVMNDGGGWTVSLLGIEQTSSRESGLAVAPDGTAWAAIHLSFSNQLVATRFDGSWSVPEVIDTEDVTRIEVGFDPAGRPVVAYGGEAPGPVQVARRGDDGSWTTGEVVAYPGDNLGSPLAFVIDRDGTEYLAFQMPIPDDLVVYRNRGDGWTLLDEDTGSGFLGLYPSLAIDDDGNPRVVHFDNTADELRYRTTAIELGAPATVAGEAWPVGGVRTLEVHGSGLVDLSLSVDGGATWEPLASNVPPGPVEIAVPNRPTRYARIEARRVDPAPGAGAPLLTASTARTEGLFTIEADITASFFRAALDGRTAHLSWETEPGLDDLRGYHVERDRGAGWSTVTPSVLRATELAIEEARPGDRLRLVAIDGLGSERRIAETVLEPRAALAARPQPYRAGPMTIHFRVAAGLDGGETDTRVELFDLTGRRVRSLVDEALPPGPATVTWDGTDARGQRAAAGVYFLRLGSGGGSRTVKVHVVR